MCHSRVGILRERSMKPIHRHSYHDLVLSESKSYRASAVVLNALRLLYEVFYPAFPQPASAIVKLIYSKAKQSKAKQTDRLTNPQSLTVMSLAMKVYVILIYKNAGTITEASILFPIDTTLIGRHSPAKSFLTSHTILNSSPSLLRPHDQRQQRHTHKHAILHLHVHQ